MDKPDERHRQHAITPARGSRRDLVAKDEPLVPEKKDTDKKYRPNADILAAGQSIVEVLASEPTLFDRNAWRGLRLDQKRELFNTINARIAKQTGQPALKGSIKSEKTTLVPKENQSLANISVAASKHPEDFAYETARLHVFDLQEKKYLSDPEYAASHEGLQLKQILSVRGNRGDARTLLLSMQTSQIGGDAKRAIITGKLLQPPALPKRDQEIALEKKVVPPRQKSMDERRLEIVNALFSDPRITNKKSWNAMKSNLALKRTLFKDLNEKIALLHDRDPLPARFGKRKTALYGDIDGRVASMQYRDADDRLEFLTAIGQMNLREFQELAREEPNRYTEIVTNAKTLDANGNERDLGLVNYDDTDRSHRARQRSGTTRIDVHTLETMLLRRDISRAYAHLREMEENLPKASPR